MPPPHRLTGAHNVTNLADPSVVSVGVASKHVYPNFSYKTADGDLALFKLDSDLPLDDPTKHLGTICLPESREPLDAKVGLSATVSGWGADVFRRSKSFVELTTYVNNIFTEYT